MIGSSVNRLVRRNMKDITIEKIENQNILNETYVTKEIVEMAIKKILEQIDLNMNYFGTKFPNSATKDNIYPIIDNIEWTDGFYTGMLWLAYEYTQDEKYLNVAQQQVNSFYHRILHNIEVDHHDLGFLYSLSCVASYKITKNPIAKKAALLAADKLISRYQAKSGFIQAWGDLNSQDHHRFIIDCMLNLPLLYWASEESGNLIYQQIADRHFETSLKYVIREDASAYHTFYMDKETGQPLKGVTRQGYSDDSSWARGQAWGIYGIPLNYRYTKNKNCFKFYHAMTNYFINRLPKDSICYWDLIFKDGDNQEKDSSSAAIAICGINEMLKYLPETNEDKKYHRNVANIMLKQLIDCYMNDKKQPGGCVLLHGVYSWHSKKGIDEGNIWGDYFFFEACMRYIRDITTYW